MREIKIWIQGVEIEDIDFAYADPSDWNLRHQLSDELELRTPTQHDLEMEIPLDALPNIPVNDYAEFSPTILELNCKLANHELPAEIESLINCLRLFKVGSVFPTKIQLYQNSILEPDRTYPYNWYYRYIPDYIYFIGGQNIQELGEFIKNIRPLLPKGLFESSNTIDPLAISIQRYNDALLKGNEKIIEGRVASAVMSFEALYLTGSEKQEFSHRLSQRASTLLQFFCFKSLEVYENIILAYDVRSSFVHGSQSLTKKNIKKLKKISKISENEEFTPDKRSYAIQDLLGIILEYVRVSILAFLQISNSTSIDKDTFVKKIDYALLDKDCYSKLEEDIKRHCPH